MRVVMARLLSEGEQGIPTACAAFAQQPAGEPRRGLAGVGEGGPQCSWVNYRCTLEFLVSLLGTDLARGRGNSASGPTAPADSKQLSCKTFIAVLSLSKE
nr:putative G8.1 protein [Homo sapiens]